MQTFRLILLCTWLLAPTVVLAQATPPAINPDTAATRLGKAFIDKQGYVGLSIGLYDHGKTYFYNFGTTEKGTQQLPTQNTLYEIGSMTKTFTSLLLAHAITEKKLSLNDDIRKYLDGSYPNLAYEGQPLRLVHLANLTSGLPDNLPDRPDIFKSNLHPDSLTAVFYRLHRNYTRANFYEDLHKVKLTRAPGTRPEHSNVATQLLGYILEKVYKMPYEELVKQYITGPRQMTSTTTALAVPAANAQRQAKGHSAPGNITPFVTLPDIQAAGGLSSSPADMLKYLQLQLHAKDPAVRLSHQLTHGSPNSEAFALNWFVTKTADSKLAFAHSGGTFGFASYCVFYPELNRGLVLFANRNEGTTESRLEELAAALEKGTYGVPAALNTLQAELKKRKYTQAAQVYSEVKKKHPELFLSEDYVNTWGYSLLQHGQQKQAVEVFKLNVHLYPTSSNPYDSLAEAYEAIGERDLAIKNYKRSLELNPANTNAVDHLKKLEPNGAKTTQK